MGDKQKIQLMDYESCLRWHLEEKLKDRRDKIESDKRRYSLHDSIEDSAKVWRINCERWRKKGQKVIPFALSLEELNNLGEEEYELIDLSVFSEESRKTFRDMELGDGRVYYTRLFRNNKCKAYLGAFGVDALIHFEKYRFSSFGFPVKKKTTNNKP